MKICDSYINSLGESGLDEIRQEARNNPELQAEINNKIKQLALTHFAGVLPVIEQKSSPGKTPKEKNQAVIDFFQQLADQAKLELVIENGLIVDIRRPQPQGEALNTSETPKTSDLILTRDPYEEDDSTGAVLQRTIDNPKLKEEVPDFLLNFNLQGEGYTAVGLLRSTGSFCKTYLALNDKGEPMVVKLFKKDLSNLQLMQARQETYRLQMLAAYQNGHHLAIDGHCLTPIMKGAGKTADGEEYFVMTMAEGVSFHDIFKNIKTLQQPFNIEEVSLIGEQACRVLESLHDGLGKSYTDFQGGNFFWNRGKKQLTVIDFNMLSGDKNAKGEKHPYNPQSDFINIGKLIFTLTTAQRFDNFPEGTFPYGEDLGSIAGLADYSEHLQGLQGRLELVEDPRMRAILKKVFAPYKADRYQTAKEMRADFEKVLAEGLN